MKKTLLTILAATTLSLAPLKAKPDTVSWNISSANIQGSTWYLQRSLTGSDGPDSGDVPWSFMSQPGPSEEWIKAYSDPYGEPLAFDSRPLTTADFYLRLTGLGDEPFVANNTRINPIIIEGPGNYAYTLYENGIPLFSRTTEEGISPAFDFYSDRNYQIGMSAVPEPSIAGLLMAGLGALGLLRKRQARKIKD